MVACSAWNAADAENTLQTVYLKILEGRAVFGGRASFRTWLFAVIRNTAAAERRRNFLLGRRLVGDERAVDAATVEHDATDPVYRAELALHLRKALAALPARQREVLHLVFHHDLTLEQAADVMQVSVGAARQHYDRAKRRMRTLLQTHVEALP